ncbi:hypothetical protein FRC06_009580 [Ceratobasidium sp. 370]|nr:hypothetical protein FRC06_009580 [Ceratobasidium sp. 370]
MLVDKREEEEVTWIEPFGAPAPAAAPGESEAAPAAGGHAQAGGEEAAPPPSVQYPFGS